VYTTKRLAKRLFFSLCCPCQPLLHISNCWLEALSVDNRFTPKDNESVKAKAITLDLPRIVQDPSLRGGRPVVEGTGVSVTRIAAWYQLGMTPEQIAREVGHLDLAQVHAALSYYFAHQEEIEQDLAEDVALDASPARVAS
jgi:uncharacterized protein (DUF433 family)